VLTHPKIALTATGCLGSDTYSCQSQGAHGSGLHTYKHCQIYLLCFKDHFQPTLHWMSRHPTIGQAPQHSGHTNLPQPPGMEHFENVLTSLAKGPKQSITARSFRASSRFLIQLALVLYVRRAASYIQHGLWHTAHGEVHTIHLRFLAYQCRSS